MSSLLFLGTEEIQWPECFLALWRGFETAFRPSCIIKSAVNIIERIHLKRMFLNTNSILVASQICLWWVVFCWRKLDSSWPQHFWNPGYSPVNQSCKETTTVYCGERKNRQLEISSKATLKEKEYLPWARHRNDDCSACGWIWNVTVRQNVAETEQTLFIG